MNGYVVTNQLQFTNKQLRSQTRAMVIRYNDVYIRGPQNHLIRFFYSIMGNKRLWIQRIHHSMNRLVADSHFDDCMASNSTKKCTPALRLSVLARGAHRVTLPALSMQQKGRHKSPFPGRITQSASVRAVFADLIGAPPLPWYITILFWGKSFGEVTMRRFCEKDGIEQKWLILFLPCGMEGLLSVAEECFEREFWGYRGWTACL